jgi:hypothetical protein
MQPYSKRKSAEKRKKPEGNFGNATIFCPVGENEILFEFPLVKSVYLW